MKCPIMKCNFTTDVKDKFLDMINHLLTVHSDHQVAATLTGLIAAREDVISSKRNETF